MTLMHSLNFSYLTWTIFRNKIFMFLSIVVQSCTIVLHQYQKVSQIFKVEYYIVKIGHIFVTTDITKKMRWDN